MVGQSLEHGPGEIVTHGREKDGGLLGAINLLELAHYALSCSQDFTTAVAVFMSFFEIFSMALRLPWTAALHFLALGHSLELRQIFTVSRDPVPPWQILLSCAWTRSTTLTDFVSHLSMGRDHEEQDEDQQ
ncbi:MAG: hypothetical protein MZU91_02990 [Desulfosudis oleivorans]|nr:hypothetical protein [Desulfosudis oleivorans]